MLPMWCCGNIVSSEIHGISAVPEQSFLPRIEVEVQANARRLE